MMTSWTAEELEQIEDDPHIGIASRRSDGSLRPYVTVWFVRSDNDLYVRSAYGPENGWYVRAKVSGAGRARVGSFEREVTFEVPDASLSADVDRAYHEKYDRYGPRIVATVVSDEAARCTLRIIPR